MAYSYYDNFNGKSRPTNSKTYNGPRSRQRSTRGKGGGSNHKRAAPSNTSPTSVADRNIGDWREPGRPVEGSSNPPTSQPETEATRQGPIGRKRTLESTNDQYGPRRGAQHPGPPLLPAMLGTEKTSRKSSTRNEIKSSVVLHDKDDQPAPPELPESSLLNRRSRSSLSGVCKTSAAQRIRSNLPSEPRQLSRLQGFRNLGNTCYMNACLQVLLSVRSFVDDLQDEPVIKAILAPLPDQNSVASQTDTEGSDSNARALSVTSKNNRQATLKNGGSGTTEHALSAPPQGPSERQVPALYKALLEISLQARRPHGIMDASPVKTALDEYTTCFLGNSQHDAHEFIGTLLDTLHEETLAHRKLVASSMVAKATQTTSDSSVIDTSGGDKPSDEPSDKSGEKRRGKRGSKRGSKRGEGKGPHGRTGTSAGSGSNGEPAVFSDAQRSSLSQHRSANESDTRPASDEASAGTAHSGNAHVDRNVPAEGSDVKNEEVPTPTTRHFDAEVEVTLTCINCSYFRKRLECYRDFSLAIPEQAPDVQEKLSLGDLLDNFFSPTEYSYTCEECGHDRVREQKSFSKLPGTLVLHIKRFKQVVEVPSSDTSRGPNGRKGTTGSSAQRGNRSNDESNKKDTNDTNLLLGFGSDGSYNGISYVKVHAPVSIPTHLSMKRFYGGGAGTARASNLGQHAQSVNGIGDGNNTSSGTGRHSSSPSTSASSSDQNSSKAGNRKRAKGNASSDPRKDTNANGGARTSGGISVDLYAREGWAGRGGAGAGIAGESASRRKRRISRQNGSAGAGAGEGSADGHGSDQGDSSGGRAAGGRLATSSRCRDKRARSDPRLDRARPGTKNKSCLNGVSGDGAKKGASGNLREDSGVGSWGVANGSSGAGDRASSSSGWAASTAATDEEEATLLGKAMMASIAEENQRRVKEQRQLEEALRRSVGNGRQVASGEGDVNYLGTKRSYSNISSTSGSSASGAAPKRPLRARYNLCGIVHHIGESALSGHYVADTCKSPDSGWTRFDDIYTTSVPEAVALEGSAEKTSYMCLYSLDQK